jgi:hypothetical protein
MFAHGQTGGALVSGLFRRGPEKVLSPFGGKVGSYELGDIAIRFIS